MVKAAAALFNGEEVVRPKGSARSSSSSPSHALFRQCEVPTTIVNRSLVSPARFTRCEGVETHLERRVWPSCAVPMDCYGTNKRSTAVATGGTESVAEGFLVRRFP